MKSSLCFLFLLALGAPGSLLGDHAQADPANAKEGQEVYRNQTVYQLVFAQLSAFAGAVHANNMDDLFNLFNTTQQERKDPEQLVKPFLKLYKMEPISVKYDGPDKIKARMIVNEKTHMEWDMCKKVESPTGWTVSVVRFVKPSMVKKLMPDLSDYIWCFADLLRCMGNTLAMIFG
ncbi:unnamed protein product [Caenorhabditis brenneri]